MYTIFYNSQLFKDDMDQLIHIVLHHIPPVIPISEDKETDQVELRKTSAVEINASLQPEEELSNEEEIAAIERKIAFLKELVMANGSYRQNLINRLKVGITMNTTFLILSHLTD